MRMMDAGGRESPDLFEDEEEFLANLSCDEEEDKTLLSPLKMPAVAEDTAEERGQSTSSGSLSLSPTVPLSRIGLNDNKAGMEGLDRAKINQIILEATKGSKYYENELRKERQVRKRVQKMLEELEKVTPAQRAAALIAADRELEALEADRDLNNIIVHIDMDAFYASVEMRDNPQLRDVPMAVGGKAMLSTSNYPARRYRVRAAMPGFIAGKLCPDLVIVPLRFEKYREASEQVREVLGRYDHQFCPAGLDESYLNLTEFVRTKLNQQQQQEEEEGHSTQKEGGGEHTTSEHCSSEGNVTTDVESGISRLSPAHWRCAEEVVVSIRREIQEKTGLTASAGIAPNMMLAKVASDMNKPNGQYTVTATREAVIEFVQKLPIRKISGIGKVTESMLNALSVNTCGDLHQQRAVLHLLFSRTSSTHFLRVSLGLGSTHVNREYVRKSMSTERTFPEVNEPRKLQQKCLELCMELASDMEQDDIMGRTVGVKLKTVSFKVKTRAVTLPQPVHLAEQLYSAASELLETEIKACSPSPLRLRLMGVRVSSLQSRRGQLDQQPGGSGRRGRTQETLDVFVQQTIPPTSTASLDGIDAHTQQSEDKGGDISVRCPVCGRQLKETQMTSINSHIDECLSLPVITSITSSSTAHSEGRSAVHERKTAESPKKTKSDSVSPRKVRGSERERGRTSARNGRRKRSTDSENTASGKRRKTLDQFWN